MRPETRRVLMKDLRLESLTSEILADAVFEENAFSPRLADVLAFIYMSAKKNIPDKITDAICRGEDRRVEEGLIRQTISTWNEANEVGKSVSSRVAITNLADCLSRDIDLEFANRKRNSLSLGIEMLAEVTAPLVI